MKLDFEQPRTHSEIERTVTDLSESSAIGLDFETTSLAPRDGDIRLIQLSDGDKKNYVIDLYKLDSPESVKLILPLLEDPKIKKIIQNAKFEQAWFQNKFNIDVKGVFDTYIAGRLIDDQNTAKLDQLADKYLDVTLDKEEQRGDWSVRELSENQLEYAIKDAYYLPPLRKKLYKEIMRLKMAETAAIEFNCTPAVADMENTGFPLNVERHAKLFEQIHQRRDAKQKELEDILNDASRK